MAKVEKREVEIVARLRDRLSRGYDKLVKKTNQVINTKLRFGRVVKSVSKSIINLRTAIAGVIAVLATRAIFNRLKEIAQSTNEIVQAARRLKIGVEEFSSLGYAAQLLGSDIEDVTDLIKDLQIRVGEAALEGGEKANLFARLGLSVRDLQDLGPVELLDQFAEGVKSIENETERLTIVDILLSDVGTRLLPLLENLTEARRDAEKYGGVITPPQSQAAEAFSRAIINIQNALSFLGREVLTVVGPKISQLINDAAAFVVEIAPRLVASLYAVGDVLFSRSSIDGKDLVDSLSEIGVELTYAMVDISVTLANAFIQSFATLLKTAALPLAGVFIQAFGQALINGVAHTIESVVKYIEGIPGIANLFGAENLRDYRFALIDGLDELNEQLKTREKLTDALTKAAAETKADMQKVFFEGENGGLYGELKRSIGGFIDAAADGFYELSDAGLAALADVENIYQRISEKTNDNDNNKATFFTEFKQGVLLVSEAFDQLTELGVRMGTTLTQSISGGVSNALLDVVEGTKDASQAFGDLAKSVLRQVADMIIQFSILRTVSGFFGAEGVSLGVFSFLQRNKGGIIPGGGPNVDSVPMLGTTGEYVIQRPAVNFWGRGLFDSLNQMIAPRAGLLNKALPVRSHNNLNKGGPVVSTGKGGPTQAIVVANDHSLDQLLTGGRSALLRHLRELMPEVNAGLPA